jgi:hypothetical protein
MIAQPPTEKIRGLFFNQNFNIDVYDNFVQAISNQENRDG